MLEEIHVMANLEFGIPYSRTCQKYVFFPVSVLTQGSLLVGLPRVIPERSRFFQFVGLGMPGFAALGLRSLLHFRDTTPVSQGILIPN